MDVRQKFAPGRYGRRAKRNLGKSLFNILCTPLPPDNEDLAVSFSEIYMVNISLQERQCKVRMYATPPLLQVFHSHGTGSLYQCLRTRLHYSRLIIIYFTFIPYAFTKPTCSVCSGLSFTTGSKAGDVQCERALRLQYELANSLRSNLSIQPRISDLRWDDSHPCFLAPARHIITSFLVLSRCLLPFSNIYDLLP